MAAGGEVDRYAARCRPAPVTRFNNPQGNMLWGARQEWGRPGVLDEGKSVLVSADLERTLQGAAALVLRDGRLDPAAPGAGVDLAGTVLRGSSSAGRPVEVAICGAEPAAHHGGFLWYRIQAWNPVAGAWENPCVPTRDVSDPRATPVAGVWDASGARRDAPGKFTFACENGAIAKCVNWGYRPWATQGGGSLVDLHQACTRLVRADYCGDGRSHTTEGTVVDAYDELGVLAPTATGAGPANRFEAAWAPDGATCVAGTRSGQPLEAALRSCADRFEPGGDLDIGGGDRCALRRKGVSRTDARLRTRILPRAPAPATDPRPEPVQARSGM